MKENDIHTDWTDADFDARCKALLENRSIAAPKPRADMFASDARKWGRWVAAVLLLSAGVGVAVTYDGVDQQNPAAMPANEGQVLTDSPAGETLLRTEEAAASNVALPVEDQPEVADSQDGDAWKEDVASPSEMAESSVTQTREGEEVHALEDGERSTEVANEQELPVENHALTEVGTEEVTEEATQQTTEVEGEESEPSTSLPSAVNSPESSEKEDNSESDADTPILKLPLTVKPGGGHR